MNCCCLYTYIFSIAVRLPFWGLSLHQQRTESIPVGWLKECSSLNENYHFRAQRECLIWPNLRSDQGAIYSQSLYGLLFWGLCIYISIIYQIQLRGFRTRALGTLFHKMNNDLMTIDNKWIWAVAILIINCNIIKYYQLSIVKRNIINCH